MKYSFFLFFLFFGFSQITLGQQNKISLEKIEVLSQKGSKYKIFYELKNMTTKVVRLGKDPVEFMESPDFNFDNSGLSRIQLNQVKGAILQNGGTLNPKQIWSYELKIFLDSTTEIVRQGKGAQDLSEKEDGKKKMSFKSDEAKKQNKKPTEPAKNESVKSEEKKEKEDWSKKEWDRKVKEAKEKERIAEAKEKEKEEAFQKKLEASRTEPEESKSFEEKVEGQNCPDLMIESVKIIKKKPKKWILVEYTIVNNGDAKAPLLKEFEKHGYQRSLGLKVFFSGDTKLGRGDVTVGGAFIGDYSKSKKEFMEPGERITEQIKIKTKNQTSFTRVVIFNIDAMQFIEECNEKNNINHLINR